MKTYYAETEIRAEVPEVWRHIVDLAGYPDWNRLVHPAGGELREGGILYVQVAGRAKPLRTRVLRLIPERELSLEARQPLGILRAVLSQRLEPIGEGWVRYVCTETFRGPLLPLMAPGLERTLGQRYEETCDALRALVTGGR
jgi:hypothetical protein